MLERDPARRRERRSAARRRTAPSGPPLAAPGRPSWVRATLSEAAWHAGLSFRGWATPLTLLMLTAMGVGGSFVHVILHADGPLLPRPHLIAPMMVEFFYLVVVFMVAGTVGVMARRDDLAGYGEMADAAPAPLGCRVAGRALAAGAVTVVFALTPALAVWMVTAFVVPDAFSLFDPLLYFGLLLAPSLLEICALVLLAHAFVRHAGAAHAVGIIGAFFVVLNNELGMTDGADLRKEPGADWLRVGVAGWVGLECVRQRDDGDAWLALLARASDRVVGALGALDAPAVSVADNGDAPWMRQYTPLATAGWGEAVGPDAAARAVDRVVAGVRAGTPLADALAQAVGADAAAALLGPPASSDVMVARTGRTLDVGGQRWRWRDGGWEPLSVPVRVTQRYGDGGRRLIGPVPTTVEPDAPFTLLDAWPSFERSPADNVWRGGDD